VSVFKQTFSSVIARNPLTEFTLSEAEVLRINSVMKQSDTECHSEHFALAQYRLREESQTDRFAKARDDSGSPVARLKQDELR